MAEPWFATDEDGETGFLVGAADVSPDEARAVLMRLAREHDYYLPAGIELELRPYREPREGDPGFDEAVLWPCAPGEPPDEMVWVVDDIADFADTKFYGPLPSAQADKRTREDR